MALSIEQQLALVEAGHPFIAGEYVVMYMAMVYGRQPADPTTLRPELVKGTLRIRPVTEADLALVRSSEELAHCTAVVELTAQGRQALRRLETGGWA